MMRTALRAGWETSAFTTNAWRVLRDPANGVFKCWYEDWHVHDDDWIKSQGWSGGPIGRYPSRYLYACSQDGVKWEKPELGIVTEDGRNTNIVFGDKQFGSVHSAFMLLDPLDNRPEQRFKAIFLHYPPGGTGSLRAAASPDGIRWQVLPERPRFGPLQELGDVLTIAVDTDSRTYLINTRHPNMHWTYLAPSDPRVLGSPPVFPGNSARRNVRRVFHAESADMLHWSELQPTLVPDEDLDNMDDCFYGLTQFRTGNFWIGLLNVFHMTDNTLDVQLAYSRDGRNFQRFQPGRPWLRTGSLGSWDQFMVNICSPPVEVGDDLYVYYGGAKNHHDWWIHPWTSAGQVKTPEDDMSQVGFCLGLVKMKQDRFVALKAGAVRPGFLVTRPFMSEGGRLLINADCKAGGSIGVEVATGDGKVVPGFERTNCEVFAGDAVTHPVVWKDKRELPKGWLKLQFLLRDARLYTFHLEP